MLYRFLKVYARVDGLYANLCEAGEINYLAWRRDFQNTTTGNEREELLCEINQLCLRMEEDLKKWKKRWKIAETNATH